MITLFTSLYVGLYWLFTNTILLESYTKDHLMLIMSFMAAELFIEVYIVFAIVMFIKAYRRDNDANS